MAKTNIREARSLNELSKIAGKARSTVTKWTQHRRFPVQREAPWSADEVNEILVWSKTLRENRADPNRQGRTAEPPRAEQDKDYWLMRKYRAQALEAEGELACVADMIADGVRWASEVRQALLLMPPAVAPLCAGKSVEDIERAIDEHLRRTLDGIADRMGDAARHQKASGGDGEGDPHAPAAEAKPVG